MAEPYRTRHVLGEDNIFVLGFDVHRWVFACSAAAVLLMVAWVVAFPAAATEGFAAALAFVTYSLAKPRLWPAVEQPKACLSRLRRGWSWPYLPSAFG